MLITKLAFLTGVLLGGGLSVRFMLQRARSRKPVVAGTEPWIILPDRAAEKPVAA